MGDKRIQKGFLKTIVLAVGTFVALLAAFWLSGWLADLIFANFIRGPVLQNITDTLSGLSDTTSVSAAIPIVVAALPSFILNPMLAQYGSQEAMISEIQKCRRNVEQCRCNNYRYCGCTSCDDALAAGFVLVNLYCLRYNNKNHSKSNGSSAQDSACWNSKCCFRSCSRRFTRNIGASFAGACRKYYYLFVRQCAWMV